VTRTAIYFTADITAADAANLADTLADGRVIACDERRAIIETTDTEQDPATETAYLHQLCDEDDRVTSYEAR